MKCPKCKGPQVEYIPFCGPAEMICADEGKCADTVETPWIPVKNSQVAWGSISQYPTSSKSAQPGTSVATGQTFIDLMKKLYPQKEVTPDGVRASNPADPRPTPPKPVHD